MIINSKSVEIANVLSSETINMVFYNSDLVNAGSPYITNP
jgi:hypothetical protein